MTSTDLYSEGDGVRVVGGELDLYATIVDVRESSQMYLVRHTLDELGDTTSLVAFEWCTRYRKQRYDCGDRVQLHGHADGENGPHESDADQPARYAVVHAVVTHPANPEWVTGYSVVELDEREPHMIRPGEIARLAKPDALRDA
jgi:hypothetical protein